jgi:phospholipid/cholesterol/gamma-HCH transport system ATP-binding protein
MAAASTAHYIEFRGVTKSFGASGEKKVLDDINFNVDPGETVAILGRSGVGKSVTLQHIMGFMKPDRGRIFVAHQDITDASEPELLEIHKKVTMVFQSGALFDSLTVGENVGFPLDSRPELDHGDRDQIIDGMLEMLEISHLRDVMPGDLSTGMKRAVAIARALAAKPEAILYDEPTTMVDPLMSSHIGNLIQKLKAQLHLTSVVVTHDMALALKVADRALFLHKGQAAYFGPIAKMHDDGPPFVREFLDLDAMPHQAGL